VRTPSRPRHTQWAFWSRRLRASAAVEEAALTACSVVADLRATAGVRSGDNCHLPPRGGGVPGRQRQPLPFRQKQWHLCPTAHGRHVAPPPPPPPPTPALPAARWQPIFGRQQHQRLSRAADPPPQSAKAAAVAHSVRAGAARSTSVWWRPPRWRLPLRFCSRRQWGPDLASSARGRGRGPRLATRRARAVAAAAAPAARRRRPGRRRRRAPVRALTLRRRRPRRHEHSEHPPTGHAAADDGSARRTFRPPTARRRADKPHREGVLGGHVGSISGQDACGASAARRHRGGGKVDARDGGGVGGVGRQRRWPRRCRHVLFRHPIGGEEYRVDEGAAPSAVDWRWEEKWERDVISREETERRMGHDDTKCAVCGGRGRLRRQFPTCF